MNRWSILLALLTLASLPALAQQSRSEISADFSGDFQKAVSGSGTADSPTYAGGLLANYRFGFNNWAAIEANYSYTRFSQYYGPPSNPKTTVTGAAVNEATLAYVLPFGKPPQAQYRPFLEAGAGLLIFSPIGGGAAESVLTRQDRSSLLYGGGVDWYSTSNHWLARFGYRSSIYKAPDFGLSTQVTNAKTTMFEPYAGFVYQF